MDLHSKMTMYLTSTMTSPVTKTAKTSKWLRLKRPPLEMKFLKSVPETSPRIQSWLLKPKPFRRFCCRSNWTSHCTSKVHSHLTM